VTLPVFHWYHCYADGAWEVPAAEHVKALRDWGFRADGITVGLVGSAEKVSAARDWFTSELNGLGPLDFISAETGFEHVTLQALHSWARGYDGEAAVLYAHTKGAGNPHTGTGHWRHVMTTAVVSRWRACAALLEDGYDAAGAAWMLSPWYKAWFFAGNFWWARSDYLARLPELPPPDSVEGTAVVFGHGGRYDAEAWLGLGNPRAYDLTPGWSPG
jgi:hypothetical protein